MIGQTEIKISGEKIGVLFGVRLYKIIKDDDRLVMTDDEADQMNGINIVYAGIRNYYDLIGVDCPVDLIDVYQLAQNNIKEYEKAIKCYAESNAMGIPVKKIAEDLKKKTKKKSRMRQMFGMLFAKTR